MDNGWLIYTPRKPHRNLRDGKVSIAPSGRVALGQFYEELGSPTSVALYYHAQRNAIGLAPIPDEDEHAYKVQKPDNSPIVNGKLFLDFHAIPHEVKQRYPAAIEQNGAGPMLVIELGGEK